MTPKRCAALLFAVLSMTAFGRADVAADQRTERQAAAALRELRALHGDVQIQVADGIVTLSGRVDDREQRALAAETMRKLPGVLAVDNQLDLATPEPDRADGWIALKVRSLLLLGHNVPATLIDVAVREGIVTLTGTVESELQRRLAAAYARDVEGVRGVRNELEVRARPQADGPATTRAAALDDPAITVEVSAALRANPAVDAERIQVEADAAVVSLRGRVRSQAEKDLAARLAQQVPAVKSVVNELVVEASE